MKVDKSKWQKKNFPQIGQSQLGKTLDSKKNKGNPYPYLCAINVGYGEFNLSNLKTILLENEELERYQVKRGDLLICEGGETGRCAIWDSEQIIYYQNALHRVRFNEGINNRYIMYAMHYYKKVGIIDKLSHGQTIQHFTQKGLNQLEFYIPSLSEQQSITAELDAVQEIIDGYKAQIADLNSLAQSIFLDMFGDPVSNPKGWEMKAIKDVTKTKSSSQVIEKINNKYWLLNLDKIEAQSGEILAYDFVKEEKLGPSVFPFDNSMVLYSKLRPYLNKVVAPQRNGYATTELVPFIPSNNLDKIYFLYLLRAPSVVRILNSTSGGARMPRTKLDAMKNLQIPLPPLPLQQQFAHQVEALEKQKTLLRQQLSDAETLMAERMQYYFN